MLNGEFTVTERDVAEAVPVEIEFRARIATVYPTPLVRPEIEIGEVVDEGTLWTHDPPLSEYSKLVMAEPLSAPVVKATERDPEPEVILVIVGAAGGCATRTEVRVGAVKLNIALFVARSAIAPPLRERLVAIAIPSVSISKSLV